MGVELFFVLSGFLIGNILIKTFISSEDFTYSKIINFWKRRWFRTLPTYWLILTINIILYQKLHIQDINSYQFLYYPFLQNLWFPSHSFFNEAWSLSIEEWFYFSLPIIMLLSSTIFQPKNKGRFLLKIFLGYLCFFVLIRFFNAFNPINGANQDEGIRKVVIFRLDAVMYGVLFAYFNNFMGSSIYKIRKALFITSIIGVGMLFLLIAKRDIQFRSSSIYRVRFSSDAFLYLLLPLFFSLSLPFAHSIKKIRFGAGVIQFISKISYSMYLIHYSLVYLPFFYTIEPRPISTAILSYILYWGAVIGLSTLFYACWEKPFMKIRDRISPG